MTEQAQRMRELRKKHLQISQQDFANNIFMKRNSIAQIETGIRSPSERTLKAISEFYNVNLEWLKKGTLPIFKKLSREEEIVCYIGQLVSNNDSDVDFQKRFIKILAKLDVEEWKMIEKIVNDLVKEKD